MPDASEARETGSVSRWLGAARAGDQQALRHLWQRYFQPLVRLARRRLSASASPADDAEDVALEAFAHLCRRLLESERALPDMKNRDHLWKLLACITVRRALDLVRREARRPAVAETVLGEAGFETLASREPPPPFAAAVADLLECLPSDELRDLARAKLAGCTNEEIARRLGRSLSTVERKLQVIRLVWREVK